MFLQVHDTGEKTISREELEAETEKFNAEKQADYTISVQTTHQR